MKPSLLSPLPALWRAAKLHLKTGFSGRRAWLGPIILIAPILFTLIAWSQERQINTFEQGIAPYTLWGGLALLLPLLYAGGAWSDEVDRKTITYLLLRPVPRWSLYLGKILCASFILASWFLIAEFCCFGILATSYPIDILQTRLWDLLHHLEALLLFALAYSAVFSFIGVLLPRFSLIASIGYGILLEVILPELPTSFRYVTIQYYIRAIAGLDPSTARGYAILILFGYTIVFLLLGAFFASRRDYPFSE